jgi:CheY-like chemotaxis protein
LSESPEKTISVRSSLLGKRVLIEIGFSASDNGDFSNFADSAGGALGLGVCRTIVAGHGGELRFVQTPGAGHRFEIELAALIKERPEIAQPRAVGAGRVNALTALVIEPDENVQRQLVAMLSAREYRVVPVQNGDAALDLGLRLRFDIALCSMRADGLNWVELSEQLQSRVEAFVLLSDGYNAELTADFSGERRFVLAKPVDEESLETVLNGIRGDAVVARQQV